MLMFLIVLLDLEKKNSDEILKRITNMLTNPKKNNVKKLFSISRTFIFRKNCMGKKKKPTFTKAKIKGILPPEQSFTGI